MLNDISPNIKPRTDTPKNRQNPQATAPHHKWKQVKFGKTDPITPPDPKTKKISKIKTQQKLLQNIST